MSEMMLQILALLLSIVLAVGTVFSIRLYLCLLYTSDAADE